MQKRGALFFILVLATILIVSFASASWLSDTWGKITGNAVSSGVTCPSGLVLYLNGDSGNDVSGNGNNILGTFSNVPSKVGKGYSLSGNVLQVKDSSSLDLTNQVTVSAWVYANRLGSSDFENIITKSSNPAYGFMVSSHGFVRAYLRGLASLDVTTSVKAATWNYVVVTWDGTTEKIYVNGVFAGSGARKGTIVTGANNIQIGSSAFSGVIDEIAIYNRAISDSEVGSLYNNGLGKEVCSQNVPAPTSCTENWGCSNWSACSGFQQVRICTDSNNCGTTNNKPALSQSCTVPVSNSTTTNNTTTNTTASNATVTCTDSDGGLNYYVKGHLVSVEQNADYWDTCTSLQTTNDSSGWTPTSGGKILMEYYCGTTSYHYGAFECPNGCVDGACVNSTPTAPTSTTCSNLDSMIGGVIQKTGDNQFSLKNFKLKDDTFDINLYYTNEVGGLIGIGKDTNNQLRTSDSGTLSFDSDTDIYFAASSLGSNESYLMRATNFKVVSGMNKTTMQYRKDGSWYVVKQDAQAGDFVYIGNVELYVVSVDYNNRIVLIRQVTPDTVFNKLFSSDGITVALPVLNGGVIICPTLVLPSSPPVETGTCGDLISKVRYPQDFNDAYGNAYSPSWNSTEVDTFWLGNSQYNATVYNAGWWNMNGDQYRDPYYQVSVFDSGVNASAVLAQDLQSQLCTTQTVQSSNGNNNVVYLCTYQYGVTDSSQYPRNNVNVYWANKNVIASFSAYSGMQLTDAQQVLLEQQKLSQVLESIKDNQYKYISLYLQYPFDGILSRDLSLCGSELTSQTNNITNETCNSQWQCKLEPVVCPPHGTQTQTCIDTSCNQPNRVDTMQCSPGECSGCYIPRWIGSNDNVCAPYGFRFAQTQAQTNSGTLQEGNFSDYSLTVTSDTTATLTLVSNGQVGDTYNLIEGQQSLIFIPNWQIGIDSVRLLPKSIVMSSGNVSGHMDIETTVDSSFNAYCDMDGQVKQQKVRDSQGNWAKCQNNYECNSNFCSGGECIEINSMLTQASGYKSMGVKVLCSLASFFRVANYNDCLVSYLGQGYVSNPSSLSNS